MALSRWKQWGGLPGINAIVDYVNSLSQGAIGAVLTALTGDVTATGPGSATATIASDAVTYAKMQNVSAASKLLGRGDSGSGDPQEITLGTNLSMSGTTLNASGSGGGTVTTTGSPASGNLAKFSGATSITNADLTGDVTTSGTLATTIANSAVTLAKIANAAANSKLVGSGSSGSGAAYSEITLGSGLSMSGTTISSAPGGSGTQTTIVAASDDSDSDNTLHDDPELVFALTTNSVYQFTMMLIFTSGTSTTPDAKYTFTLPTSATISIVSVQYLSTGTTAADVSLSGRSQASSAFTAFSPGVLSTATVSGSGVMAQGIIRTGANAGNAQLQWSQNTTTGGTPTVRKADSYIQYTKVS